MCGHHARRRPLRVPEGGDIGDNAKHRFDPIGSGVKLLVDLDISLNQFEAPVEQAVNDPVLAGQDLILDIIGLVGAEGLLANLGRIGHH